MRSWTRLKVTDMIINEPDELILVVDEIFFFIFFFHSKLYIILVDASVAAQGFSFMLIAHNTPHWDCAWK